jgi:hypothetical protein
MNRQMIVKLAAEAAVNAAMTYIDQQRCKEVKSRHDKRLRNTRLLLKNYKLLKDHCQSAVFDKKEVLRIQEGNIIDLLDSLDAYGKNDFIESIKNSVSRTQVIIAHIDAMMEIYRIYCEKSDKPEESRRYRIIRSSYFDDPEMPPAEICKLEGIDQSTYYRDKRASFESIGALIFGIDGLSAMRKTC